MTINFQEYCEDILDQHIGLMSSEQIKEAMAGYQACVAPKLKTEKTSDSKLKLAELKSKLARLVSSQKIAIERNSDKDISTAEAFVKQAEEALEGKATKANLLVLISLNSEVSRYINSQSI